MFKLKGNIERFEVEITKEFRTNNFIVKIEQVKDMVLKKIWYNVIWGYTPDINTYVRELIKFMYRTKSKTYKNEKQAIKHFNEIINSHLK